VTSCRGAVATPPVALACTVAQHQSPTHTLAHQQVMVARKMEQEGWSGCEFAEGLVNVASLPYNNLGPVNCSEKNLVARPQQRSVRNEYYQPCLDPLQERQCPHRGDTGVKSDLQKSVHFEAGPKGRKGNKPLFTAIYR